MHPGGDVNIHAHIKILKLSVHQRVDADTADAGLERSRRHRHAIANFERGLLSVKRAYLWILN